METRLQNKCFFSDKTQRITKFLITMICIVLISWIIAFFLPDKNPTEDTINIGLIALIPAIFLIVYIFFTKQILEALIIASLICFVFSDKGNFLTAFNDGLTSVMCEEDTVWLIIVCGLMGSIIKLIEHTGGSFAFGQFVANHSKTKVGTLLWTFLLGIIVFIDDYLNSLTIGSSMTAISDKHNVSREELAYIVDSTAAPVCVLIPISTWAVFASRLFVVNGLTTEQESLNYFIKTIPFNFYAWAALLIVLLYILGIIKPIGRMKKAVNRVKNGGPLAPAGSEKIDIHGNSKRVHTDGKIIDFILPIACLVLSTILCDVDMQKGVIITLGFMYFLYVGRGLITASEFADCCVEGIKNMLLPLILMVLAFLFSYASNRIQFTETIISSVLPIMKQLPQFMPLIIFIILGITEFITGTNWGLYIIALPIVIPLSQAVGANTILSISAVLSAGVFGSHVCFYSDATIISSSACGCDNFEHGMTQMSYGLISAFLAMIAFIIAGFLA